LKNFHFQLFFPATPPYLCGVINTKTKTKKIMAQRDPQTGRFLKKAETTTKPVTKPGKKTAAPSPVRRSKPAAEPAPKAKKEKAIKVAKAPKQTPAQKEIADKIQKVLETPLKVFIKKDITGSSKNIGPGSSIILEKLSVIGPTGSHVFRVKRENSDRTYYTVEENIPQ
jgi:hypothetical protein